MIVEKPWGTTECVLKTPFVEAHRIVIAPSGECSWHKHERKWNAFILVSGALDIISETRSPIHCCEPGALVTVPPGECHSFHAWRGGAVVVELYYPAELSEDIVRYNATHLEDVA